MGTVINFSERPTPKPRHMHLNRVRTSVSHIQAAAEAVEQAVYELAQADLDPTSQLTILHQLRTSMQGLQQALAVLGTGVFPQPEVS